MKKLSMNAPLALFIVLFTFTAYGQNRHEHFSRGKSGDQMERSGRHMERMAKDLNLTEDQKIRMKEMRNEKMARREDMKRNRIAFKAEERMNDDRKLKSILNKEQYRTFEKRKANKENSRHMKGDHKREHHSFKQGRKHPGGRKMWRIRNHGQKG